MIPIDKIDKILKTAKRFQPQYISHYATIAQDTHSVMIMLRSGKAFARMYWYGDDNETVYLDYLSVNEGVRKQGIGTRLQFLREIIGIGLGFKYARLQVNKNSWMHDWYVRRRYEYLKDHEEYPDFVWMIKKLQ